MNTLFFDVLVVILLFLVVLGYGWVHIVKERVSRVAQLVDSLQARIATQGDTLIDLDTKLPKVKLMELQELFGALKSEFDGVLVENDAFRVKCRNQMQRFDSIMRRNKAVMAKGGIATVEPGETDVALDDDDDGPLPQRFLAENRPVVTESSGATVSTVPATSRDEARAAMREKWKKNRGL